MLKVIGIDEAVDLLRRAVEDKGPEYIDPNSSEDGCVNMNKDEDGNLCPSCIVGHVLVYAGVDMEFLFKYNGEAADTCLLVNEYVEGFDITKEAVAVLRVAQQHQDSGKTWRDAVNHARHIADILKGTYEQ
jgi:hypothetical protein